MGNVDYRLRNYFKSVKLFNRTKERTWLRFLEEMAQRGEPRERLAAQGYIWRMTRGKRDLGDV